MSVATGRNAGAETLIGVCASWQIEQWPASCGAGGLWRLWVSPEQGFSVSATPCASGLQCEEGSLGVCSEHAQVCDVTPPELTL
jgi:hypothetical protein